MVIIVKILKYNIFNNKTCVADFVPGASTDEQTDAHYVKNLFYFCFKKPNRYVNLM